MLKVLGIETSCDDTGVAIVNEKKGILSNIVTSQIDEHQAFKGVVPEIAARAHLQNLPDLTRAALATARIDLPEIDAIAATAGPGLIGGLIVGYCFAKGLASALKKPFIAINHLEGHALTARLAMACPYPYLLLLVSGGHCQFVAIERLGKYKILGQSLDDAIGEAFDKVAKMLGLGFPGGQAIEKRAKLGNQFKHKLPRPMLNQQNCDMSFSGLKTAVRLLIASHNQLTEQDINDIAASFQYTVGEIVRLKTLNAIKIYEKLVKAEQNHLVIAGGVAANQYLRNVLQTMLKQLNYVLVAPPKELCTDNAAMIAYVGIERLKAGLLSTSTCPRARWNLEELNDFA